MIVYPVQHETLPLELRHAAQPALFQRHRESRRAGRLRVEPHPTAAAGLNMPAQLAGARLPAAAVAQEEGRVAGGVVPEVQPARDGEIELAVMAGKIRDNGGDGLTGNGFFHRP